MKNRLFSNQKFRKTDPRRRLIPVPHRAVQCRRYLQSKGILDRPALSKVSMKRKGWKCRREWQIIYTTDLFCQAVDLACRLGLPSALVSLPRPMPGSAQSQAINKRPRSAFCVVISFRRICEGTEGTRACSQPKHLVMSCIRSILGRCLSDDDTSKCINSYLHKCTV